MRMKKSAWHYTLAVATLFVSAGWMHIAKQRGYLIVLKKALPIRRLLKDFDKDALLPYHVADSTTFSPDLLQELGTEEYISWFLSAPGEEYSKENRRTLVSVTYYTGVVDQVPHVPEECYTQGAASLQDDDTLDMQLPVLGREVPVRKLAFVRAGDLSKSTIVYYTICVNGDFYSTRQLVRLRMGDDEDTHLYYSKVEIAFLNVRPKERRSGELDKPATEIMDRLLVELVKSHWPEKGTEHSGANPDPGA